MARFIQGNTLRDRILLSICAAILYGVLNWAFSGLTLPGAPVISLRPQIAIPIVMGLVYGPVPGFIAGFLGNILGDYLSGYGLTYWNWSIGNGLLGAISGLVYLFGIRNIKSVIQFGYVQLAIVMANLVGLTTATLVESLALHRVELQDAILNWLLPGLITNILIALALVPLLMILLKRMVMTIETRTILVISLLLVVSVLATTAVLISRANDTLITTILATSSGETVDASGGQITASASLNLFRWAGLVAVFVLLAGTIVSVFMVKRLTAPVSLLCTAASTIGLGQYETSVISPVAKRDDELGELARTFDNMVESLKEHIEELKRTTAAKERIESELRVATDIQMSMLPRVFPPFPDRKEFDIFATMQPAKEVGGDLYDFFLVQPDKLCFIIGDVCDKGVPAALFMAITKALLKTAGMAGFPPDDMLSRTNNVLYPENDASMFATVFCAILDTNTGELIFANAGHNPPLHYDGSTSFDYIKLSKGFVVGPMPDIVFTCQSMTLRPGQAVFLYTDGVTEAADSNNEFYSEARLQQALTKLKDEDATGMVKGIQEDVATFIHGAQQSDDITMLAVRFLGKSGGV